MANHILKILEVLLEEDTTPDEPNIAGEIGGVIGQLLGGSEGYVQGAAIGTILHRMSTSSSNLAEKIHNLSTHQQQQIIKLVMNILRAAKVPESVVGVTYLAANPNLRNAILKEVRKFLEDA